jgi:hypothetical protein
MYDYVQLEDKILNLMSTIIDTSHDSHIKLYEQLTDEFKLYWTTYQDGWSEEYWEVYNLHRSDLDENTEKHIITTSESTIEGDFERLKSQSRNSTKNEENKENIEDIFMNSLQLKKIDDEIEKIQEPSLIKEKKEEKKRGCVDCVIF